MLRRVSIVDAIFGLFAFLGLVVCDVRMSEADDAAPPAKRVAWTQSRVEGSPEPPLPLALEPLFPKLKFNDPMHVRWQADLERYFVCELAGKIWSFPHDQSVSEPDLAIDLKSAIQSFDTQRSSGCNNLFSIVFDPDFAKNRFIYACMTFQSKLEQPLADGTRVSRFHVNEAMPPRIDPDSELPIITWLAGGHNGSDLVFDNSGCLLISTGDAAAPSPPDRLKTGQDTSDLLASVLRLDVRGATRDRPYKIPTDNPFATSPENVQVNFAQKESRPEVWAFGFRNPWRMTADAETGQVWLGDVGWEKWELIHRVESGGNYGWSVREGHELIQPDEPLGKGPVRPPRVALSHADAASITGGFVYRGAALDTLQGHYLFGDWITGRIWSLGLDEAAEHREVASGQLRIIAFSPDRNGEPIVVNHLANTPLYKLVKNADYDSQIAQMRNFPRLLSQTGLFADTALQKPSPGVRRFEINQQQWQDGAVGHHYLALPDRSQIKVYNEPQPVGALAMFNSRLFYPAGTVLAKTLAMPTGIQASTDDGQQDRLSRPIETQLLHFDGRLWRGYSYVWNDAKSDAELVPASGMELTLPAGNSTTQDSLNRGQRWRIHSRSECMQCHNPWPETTLAFTPEQLHQPNRGADSTWLALVREGFVVTENKQHKSIDPLLCVRKALSSSPENSTEDRARSYLHANCAHCHQLGAGAAVDLSLKIADAPQAMKAIDIAPSKGTLGLNNAKLIASGDRLNSVLLARMLSSSTGRMPHIGSREVDFQAVTLIGNWIDSLRKPGDSPSAGVSLELKPDEVIQQAKLLVESLAAGKESNAYAIKTRAMALAAAMARVKAAEMEQSKNNSPPNAIVPLELLKPLARSADPLVSSLFEAFIPADERLRRLGPGATYAEIADIPGDARAGETWFFDTVRSQCSKCHRIGDRGGQIGPDLTLVGKKSSPTQLFEALVDPSRIIEPKFQSHTLLLSSGKIATGLLVEETENQVSLINLQGETTKIDPEEIETRKVDPKSIMPSGLVSEMTAQQAADLLAYLASLK